MNSSLTKTPSSDYRFAFLVHPRGFHDVYKTYPITRFIPKWIIRKAFLLVGPLVVGKVYGLKTENGESVHGDIISVPMVARDMLDNRKLASEQVCRSIALAEKRGAKIVGLGSLTSPVVGGGADVVGKYSLKITNGNALTVFMAYEGIKIICERKGVDMKEAQFAIVGATGSTGSAISKLLIRDSRAVNQMLLGRTPEHLEKAQQELMEKYPDAQISISTNVHDVITADVVVVATSAEGAIILASDLKQNAVVYDVTQPQNVPPSIAEERPDVTVIDGAISLLPENVGYTVNMGLAKGESFSCLAETMILGQEKYNDDFSVGKVTLENIDTIGVLSKKYGFKRAPLRSWGKII